LYPDYPLNISRVEISQLISTDLSITVIIHKVGISQLIVEVAQDASPITVGL
jgi:hypothetical protein